MHFHKRALMQQIQNYAVSALLLRNYLVENPPRRKADFPLQNNKAPLHYVSGRFLMRFWGGVFEGYPS